MECAQPFSQEQIVSLIGALKKGADATPWRLDNPCQAVIYEMHLRDLTKSPTSGVDESLRGTHLGLAKKELSIAMAMTAFDYIRQLGVNVVQLQPISDRYKQYDEEGRDLQLGLRRSELFCTRNQFFQRIHPIRKQTMKSLKL